MAVSVAIPSRTALILAQISALPADERRIFNGVTWAEYQELLDELGEQRNVLVSFSKGALEIMSLSRRHERYKESISMLMYVLSEELNINIEPNGSTTLQLESIQVAVEPDTSFFIGNASLMAGKETLDLLVDPPPDLVVEIDVSRPRYSKKEIYVRISVPELWQYDGQTFKIFALGSGQYVETDHSLIFPFIRADGLAALLEQNKTENNLSRLRNFREWVRANKPTE
jgi:Uma2 family endonuclease